MAELFIQIAVSLDGYIEDADRGLDWFVTDGSFDRFATETLRSIDGMVFGRKAYELMQEFWPTAGETTDNPELREQAKLMNSLPRYVLTRGRRDFAWAGSRAVSLEDLGRIKASAARPIAVFAGAETCRAVLAAGLVDELRLVRYPVMLGAGTPLFVDGAPRRELRLAETSEFSSGAVLSRYRPRSAAG
jgi:dihydrofolate reductase